MMAQKFISYILIACLAIFSVIIGIIIIIGVFIHIAFDSPWVILELEGSYPSQDDVFFVHEAYIGCCGSAGASEKRIFISEDDEEAFPFDGLLPEDAVSLASFREGCATAIWKAPRIVEIRHCATQMDIQRYAVHSFKETYIDINFKRASNCRFEELENLNTRQEFKTFCENLQYDE